MSTCKNIFNRHFRNLFAKKKAHSSFKILKESISRDIPPKYTSSITLSSIPILGLAQATVGLAIWMSMDNQPIKSDFENLVSINEIIKHNTLQDCWIAIDGHVYDVTKFLQIHPGGATRILQYAGKDASSAFKQMHSGHVIDKMKDHVNYLGLLDGEFEFEELSEEDLLRMEKIEKKPPISQIFNLSDFEYVAKEVLPKSIYTYFATGSSDEFSLRENRYSFSRIFFRPKMLQDVENVDTSSTLLGSKVDLPIYISGFAGSKMAHPLAERNLQKGAYKEKIIQMVPKFLSYDQDEFFNEVPSDQNQWYQIHCENQEELEGIKPFVEKISSFKTVKGIFFNVDTADLGNREKDSKVRAENKSYNDDLAVVANNGNAKYPKRFTLKLLKKIMTYTDLPICLKGLQRGEDVVIAAENGVKAVVISNHGGRQLDFSRPPLEVLCEAKMMLKEKGLEDTIELYIDGGIRRGSDIVKALCLGAKGVGLGRPFLYAMASYGEDGVVKLIDILKSEVKNNMTLLGASKIEDLDESFIDISSLKFKNPTINDRLYEGAYEQLSSPKFKI